MPIPHRKDIKAQLVELLSFKGSMTTTDVYAVFLKSWQLTEVEISKKRAGGVLYKGGFKRQVQQYKNQP